MSCTGLLSSTFLDRLALHVDRFPPMAAELNQLRTATQQMRIAEKALAAAATGSGRGIQLAQVQAARQALRTQVQRLQMVLQGHQKDFGHHTPNLSKVTHQSTCQADWKRLQRILKSIDAASAAVTAVTTVTAVHTPTEAMPTPNAAERWLDLCARRKPLTQTLRSVHAHAEQADWTTASHLLRKARPRLQALLADAQQLATSGNALLLDPEDYTRLNTFLRETPQRLATLDRFQGFIDRERRRMAVN